MLIVFPLIWYIYFVISRCASLMNNENNDDTNNTASNDEHTQNETEHVEVELYGDSYAVDVLNVLKYQKSTSTYRVTNSSSRSDE
eukprot:UN02904